MNGHQDPSNDLTRLDLTTTQPAPGVDASPQSSPSSPRRWTFVIAAAALAALAAGAVTAFVASGDSGTTALADPVVSAPTAAPTAAPALDPGVGQGQSDAADGAGPDQPQPPPEPPAAPGELKVSKTNIVLPDGVYEGSFTVSNVGESSFDWSWTPGGFGISASPNGGTLAPGESVVVNFEINPFAISEGDFAYAAGINSDVGSKGVTITGYREAIVVNPDLDLPDLDLES